MQGSGLQQTCTNVVLRSVCLSAQPVLHGLQAPARCACAPRYPSPCTVFFARSAHARPRRFTWAAGSCTVCMHITRRSRRPLWVPTYACWTVYHSYGNLCRRPEFDPGELHGRNYTKTASNITLMDMKSNGLSEMCQGVSNRQVPAFCPENARPV
jgi:hypothetical protein